VVQDALTALVLRWRTSGPPDSPDASVATAVGTPIAIEPGLPSEPVSFNFRKAPTAEVLNVLCSAMQCAWDFDSVRGLRVMAKP
jgi:hypothetical protein